MIKIGVISDTHSLKIPDQVFNDFKDVDFIVHAGDFCSMAEFQQLSKIKEVKAVWGNMDDHQMRELLPDKQVIECGGYTIGVYHGDGAPAGLIDRVQEKFMGEKVDVIIFGHSHQPLVEQFGEVLLFNPGSPNDDVFAPYKSYGLITIDEGEINAKIIKVKQHG